MSHDLASLRYRASTRDRKLTHRIERDASWRIPNLLASMSLRLGRKTRSGKKLFPCTLVVARKGLFERACEGCRIDSVSRRGAPN
jgi:hypothetical protein